MKLDTAVCILPLLFCPFHTMPANPFASKIGHLKEEALEASLVYRGYIVIGGERFAIVERNGEQQTLEEGETAKGIRIVKIAKGRLQYALGGEIRSVDLNPERLYRRK